MSIFWIETLILDSIENVKVNEILYAIFIFVYEITYARNNFDNTTFISQTICNFGKSQYYNIKIKIILQNKSFGVWNTLLYLNKIPLVISKLIALAYLYHILN